MKEEIRKEDFTRYEHENGEWENPRWIDSNKDKILDNPSGIHKDTFSPKIYIHALQSYI